MNLISLAVSFLLLSSQPSLLVRCDEKVANQNKLLQEQALGVDSDLDQQRPSNRSATRLGGSRTSFLEQVASNEQWLMKTIGDLFKMGDGLEASNKRHPGRETFEKLLEKILPMQRMLAAPGIKSPASSFVAIPSTTTTTATTSTTTTIAAVAAATTTTTPEPEDKLQQSSRSLNGVGALGTVFNSGAKLLENQMKVLNGLLLTGANLTPVSPSTLAPPNPVYPPAGYAKGGRVPAAAMRRKQEARRQQELEDESKYYEFADTSEPYAYRRPKYFSRECPFRFACEVGKLTRPLTHSVAKSVEASKFVQDLQNRYTRAMTYGTIRGDCERYYCVLVKMLGGPIGFASGVAEIVNRAMNSDMYEDYGVSRRKESGKGLTRMRPRLPASREYEYEEYYE